MNTLVQNKNILQYKKWDPIILIVAGYPNQIMKVESFLQNEWVNFMAIISQTEEIECKKIFRKNEKISILHYYVLRGNEKGVGIFEIDQWNAEIGIKNPSLIPTIKKPCDQNYIMCIVQIPETKKLVTSTQKTADKILSN